MEASDYGARNAFRFQRRAASGRRLRGGITAEPMPQAMQSLSPETLRRTDGVGAAGGGSRGAWVRSGLVHGWMGPATSAAPATARSRGPSRHVGRSGRPGPSARGTWGGDRGGAVTGPAGTGLARRGPGRLLARPDRQRTPPPRRGIAAGPARRAVAGGRGRAMPGFRANGSELRGGWGMPFALLPGGCVRNWHGKRSSEYGLTASDPSSLFESRVPFYRVFSHSRGSPI